MNDSVIALIPVQPHRLTVGKPLPSPIYDWHGKLLHAAGEVIDSQERIDELSVTGYVNDSAWDLRVEPADAAAPAAMSAPKDEVLSQLMDATAVSPVSRAVTEAPPARDNAKAEAAGGDSARDVIINLDDVRWFVGETFHLQQIDNAAVRYTVRLIGFVKNKTVFVTAPVIDGKLAFIRDGQTFIVRAFSGKKAYAFTAAAVKSAHSPHPYLHLSYPKQVRCTVVRRGARAQVKIVAAVSLADGSKPGAAVLTDLSMGGASGMVKQPLGQKGDMMKVKFKVQAAGQDEYLNLTAVLRSVGPADQGDGFKHGFEFVDVSIHDRLILSAFVHQTLAEGE